MSVEEIYRALGISGIFAIIAVGLWAVAAGPGAVIAVALVARRASPSVALTVGLGISASAIAIIWYLSLGLGIGLADRTPGFSGGAPGYDILYWSVGQGLLIAVILRTVAPPRAQAMQAQSGVRTP
jgi:hypothetical protein